jgi:hypothetical protein
MQRITKAMEIIAQYGDIDGAHHKQWVLDQVVRVLVGDEEHYQQWLTEYRGDYDPKWGGYEYDWDEGIAP